VNAAAGEASLGQLQAEIDARLKQELGRIAADERAAAAALREEHGQKLASHLAALTKQHEINRKRAAAQLNIEMQQRARAAVWKAEKLLLDQLQQAVQERLVAIPCTQQRFDLWLADALSRLDGGNELELFMNPAWTSAVSSVDIPVVATEMLGGARLLDKDSGRMLDGSWDLRLQDM